MTILYLLHQYSLKGNTIITKLKYGNTNTYFVSVINGGLLINTDYAGILSDFYRALKKSNISMTHITYILATYYYLEHIGFVSELTKMGIKLLLLDTQYDYVHFADIIFKRERHLLYEPIDENNVVIITCNDNRNLLANIGIVGEIIMTTSHSEDSISVILNDGERMVGDLEPLEYIDAYKDNIALQNDCRLFMSYKPKVVYYAHVNERHFA